MNRLAVAASLSILAAFLAGCASRPAEKPANVTITPVEQSYRAGTGVVQAVTPAPGSIAAGPRADSGKVPDAKASGLQRLRIRMDDGSTMYVDTSSKDFAPGQRVQLTAANQIQRQ